MRPVLIIVAGPNGSGKTSLTRTILRHEWVEGCRYVNPDDIARDMFGDWNDPECVLKAAKEATRQRHECLRLRQSHDSLLPGFGSHPRTGQMACYLQRTYGLLSTLSS